jgi:hypothetical protein
VQGVQAFRTLNTYLQQFLFSCHETFLRKSTSLRVLNLYEIGSRIRFLRLPVTPVFASQEI